MLDSVDVRGLMSGCFMPKLILGKQSVKLHINRLKLTAGHLLCKVGVLTIRIHQKYKAMGSLGSNFDYTLKTLNKL